MSRYTPPKSASRASGRIVKLQMENAALHNELVQVYNECAELARALAATLEELATLKEGRE